MHTSRTKARKHSNQNLTYDAIDITFTAAVDEHDDVAVMHLLINKYDEVDALMFMCQERI